MREKDDIVRCRHTIAFNIGRIENLLGVISNLPEVF